MSNKTRKKAQRRKKFRRISNMQQNNALRHVSPKHHLGKRDSG